MGKIKELNVRRDVPCSRIEKVSPPAPPPPKNVWIDCNSYQNLSKIVCRYRKDYFKIHVEKQRS